MFQDFLTWLNDFMYTYILIFLLVGCGLYYSIRTRFVQVRKIKDVLSILKEKANSDGSDTKQVSSFQALMISTASRVGTGNIAGIATAIAAGGPGAVFWQSSAVPLLSQNLLWLRFTKSKTEPISAEGLPTISSVLYTVENWEFSSPSLLSHVSLTDLTAYSLTTFLPLCLTTSRTIMTPYGQPSSV